MCETAAATADLGDFMWYCCNLAQALLGLDRDDEAEQWLDRGRETAPSEEPLPQILWRQVRGKVLARRGELQEGERLAREAVARAEETDMLNAHADALIDLAEVLALAGQDARGGSTERSRSTSGRAISSWRSARDRDWRSSRRLGKSRSRRRTSLTVRKGRRLR